MNSPMLDSSLVLARLHIDDLHREAAGRRLAQDGTKDKSERRRAPWTRPRRAAVA